MFYRVALEFLWLVVANFSIIENRKLVKISQLTYFMSLVSFFTSVKYQKISDFFMFSGGIKKRPMAWNKLKKKFLCKKFLNLIVEPFWIFSVEPFLNLLAFNIQCQRRYIYVLNIFLKTTRCVYIHLNVR